MRSLLKFFIGQPIWSNAMTVVALMFGIYCLFSLKSSFFPELDPRMVMVNVVYPGASPQEMEEGVTIKIEQALRGIDGVESINSTSSENSAQIKVVGLEGCDMDDVYRDVETAVSAINSFPEGAEKPTVVRMKSNPMSERVMIVGLDGDTSLQAIKREADRIENDLYSSGLISEVDLRGMPELELVVELRESDMLKYKLSFDEVSMAIRINNQDLTGGILRNEKEELVIRSRERKTDPEEISKIILRTTSDGQRITIADVANVKLDFAESSIEAWHNGNKSITMEIKKTSDQDMAAITDFVREYSKKYNDEDHPCEMNIQLEFMKTLNDRIDLLTTNGFQGLCLVLLMLGIFMSTRLSIWVAFGIPFAFLGMFVVAYLMGFTINLISLFGMILVVGILVDDGIVIAENVYTHFERGKSPFKAALDGTLEVIPSVFSSVITTIAAFVMLLFVDMMEMMHQMAWVVILALSFSLFEAFFLLPVHLASHKILKRPNEATFRGKVRVKLTRMVDYLRDKIFAEILDFVLQRYRAYILLPLLFAVAIGILFKLEVLKFTFFPEIKPEVVNVEVAFMPGTSKEETKKWIDFAEKAILTSNQELVEASGDTLLADYSVALGMSQSLGEFGSHTGMFTLTIEGEGKKTPVDSLIERIRAKMNAFEMTKSAKGIFIGGTSMTFGKPIEYSFTGNDDAAIRRAKDRFKEYLAYEPDINNLKDNEPLGRKEITLQMKPDAELYGFDDSEVIRQVRQGVFGQEVQRVIIGTDEVKMWVRYAKEDRQGQHDMENIRIKSADGKRVLLSQMANYAVERGPVSLKRRDGRREIVVDAGIIDPKKVREINQRITDEILPKIQQEFPMVDVIQRGQGERSTKTMASMQINMGILMVVMLILITLNFRSVYQGMLILICIPAGLAGGILGHAIVGIPVTILSMFGLIALVGILVNDAIVFLDTYNRNIVDGMQPLPAAREAARSRFRPIVLTSVTTIAGLMPIIAETSFQAQFLIPMATSVAFGLLFGTIFVLFFFPTVILVATDVSRAFTGVANETWMSRHIVKPPTKKRLNVFFVGVLRLVLSLWIYLIGFILFPLFVFFPNKFLNKLLLKVWRDWGVPNGRSVEPALLLLKEDDERKIED